MSDITNGRNIFWSDIPKSSTVYDLKASFVAVDTEGRAALVYWTGNDAGRAQQRLKMRAVPGPIPPLTPKAPAVPYAWKPGEREALLAKIEADKSSACVIVCNFPRKH